MMEGYSTYNVYKAIRQSDPDEPTADGGIGCPSKAQSSVFSPIHRDIKSPKDLETKIQHSTLENNHNCKPPRYTSRQRNDFLRALDEKFVVNLFESRQTESRRQKGKQVGLNYFEKEPTTQIAHGRSYGNFLQVSVELPTKHEEIDKNNVLWKLKKLRDMECVRITQASNVLKLIKVSSSMDWSDELLAEKILLEADEKYTLLLDKIRTFGYKAMDASNLHHTATVKLENFEFLLKEEARHGDKLKDFFIMSLSHGTELLISRVSTPRNNKLTFLEQFTFTDLHSDFGIKLKIFSLKLRTDGRKQICCSVLKKDKKILCPSWKIYYKDVNTYQMEASSVLKPSFKCCAEATLTKEHIGSSNLILSRKGDGIKLLRDVNFSFSANDLKLSSKTSGFLTVGVPGTKHEILFWERKWCVLQGTKLSFYNYPSEQDFSEAIFCINLKCCIDSVRRISKRRSFLLKTAEALSAGDVDESNVVLKNTFSGPITGLIL